MLNNSTSVWLGITFVLVGAINVWLILQTSAKVKNAKVSARLIAAHRIGGYLFIALFCVMGYFMLARLGDVAGGTSPGVMIHLTIAMILSPLIFVKVLIARYYKSHYSFLMPIGLVIFVLSFVLIGITTGPSLIHHASMETVSLATIDLPPAAIDITLAAATMEKRCSKCHALDRLAGARKDARGWLATVRRMKALPDSGISEDDARMIVSYLASQMAPKGSVTAASLEVARALVDQRCGRCHGLDRVYKTTQTPDEWKATVTRMVGFADGSTNAFQPGEDQQIIAYLSATQTPDALDRKKTKIAAASPADRGLVTQEVSPSPDKPGQRGPYDSKMIGFISLVCLGMLALIIRRPARALPPGSDMRAGSVQLPIGTIPTAASTPSAPLILKLASITTQTSDSKTLRFALPLTGSSTRAPASS